MALRIEAVHGHPTFRVLDGPGERRAVALLTPLPDRGVLCEPVEFDSPPAPLTGETIAFAALPDALAFLGIQLEALAA